MLPKKGYSEESIGAETLGEALLCLFALILELEESFAEELVEELLILECIFNFASEGFRGVSVCQLFFLQLRKPQMAELELASLQDCREDAPADLADLSLILVDKAQHLEG